MIKRLLPITSIVAVLSISPPIYAQNFDNNEYNQMNQNLQNVGQYLKNLGGYLGFDLTQQPPGVQTSPSDNTTLVENVAQQQVAYGLSVFAFIGARPVDSLMKLLAPGAIPGMNIYNNYTNAVYINPGYNSGKVQQGKVSANPLIDQPDYQQDPISQAILNILGTPNDSYCISYDGKTYNSDCNLITQGIVSINGIGELPNPQAFFTYNTVKSLLPQLNLNSLTGPLVYNTEAQNQSPTSSPLPSSNQNKGLQTLSQAQAAQNFIRNASGSLLRPTLPSQQTYDTIYAQAMNLSKNTSLLEQKAAQKTLSQYMAQLRTFAAQMSIGVSNLYYSLAKRMPQNPTNKSGQTPTSQALSEFQMATHRLLNPDSESNQTQWVEKINNASSATVQKEIAILLAEINYQLYLNRQIQERILLTNSVILFNSTGQSRPDGSSLSSSGSTGGN